MSIDPWITAVHPITLCRLIQASPENHARTRIGRRKLRLAGCGTCRLHWSLFSKGQNQQAIETAEGLAEGELSKGDAAAIALRAWWKTWVWSRSDRRAAVAARTLLGRSIWDAARAGEFLLHSSMEEKLGITVAEGRKQFCEVYRCIFDNPLSVVQFDKSWRSSDVVGLAQSIHATGNYGQLPILADALQEAGCDDAELLRHCMEEKHARGCRVIDHVLGMGQHRRRKS